MRRLSRMPMPRWSARPSRRSWITLPWKVRSVLRTGSRRMTRRLRGIRSFRSRRNQQRRPARAAGLFFVFLMGFVFRFFCVVDSRIFREKRVFVRGVLWIADGKMCGKRGLRDALFGLNWVDLDAGGRKESLRWSQRFLITHISEGEFPILNLDRCIKTSSFGTTVGISWGMYG